jgi:protocatechuate 3,4-dioxygenase beta subunit
MNLEHLPDDPALEKPTLEELDNDDEPVGEILSRRQALALFGAAGGVLLGTASSGTASSASKPLTLPSCVVRPEMTEGPFFVDDKLKRTDIRSDPSSGVMSVGVPLILSFLVSKVGTGSCAPLTGAMVDVWHCDALGNYSDVQGSETQGKQFLRGYQLTDAKGVAKFTTVYPGWYRGRAVHIHFKIRMMSGSSTVSEFTSQLFFNEKVTDVVHAQPPYAQMGKRTVLNSGDGIYRNGGSQLLISPTRSASGYAATFGVGMNLRS